MSENLRLNIEIIEARDLPKMDLIGKVDPYCEIFLSSDPEGKKRTKTIKKNYNPVWNEVFYFMIRNMADTIVINLYDYDLFKHDDSISSIRIPLTDIPRGKIIDTWYSCCPVKGVKKGGSIHFKVHITREGQVPFRVHQVESGISNELGSLHNSMTLFSNHFIQESRKEMIKREKEKFRQEGCQDAVSEMTPQAAAQDAAAACPAPTSACPSPYEQHIQEQTIVHAADSQSANSDANTKQDSSSCSDSQDPPEGSTGSPEQSQTSCDAPAQSENENVQVPQSDAAYQQAYQAYPGYPPPPGVYYPGYYPPPPYPGYPSPQLPNAYYSGNYPPPQYPPPSYPAYYPANVPYYASPYPYDPQSTPNPMMAATPQAQGYYAAPGQYANFQSPQNNR